MTDTKVPPRTTLGLFARWLGVAGASLAAMVLIARALTSPSAPPTVADVSTPSTLTARPAPGVHPTGAHARCDRACAAQHLLKLEAACNGNASLACADDARAAAIALDQGRCQEARLALARISVRHMGLEISDPSLEDQRFDASMAVNEACATETIRPLVPKRAQLVRLAGSSLAETIEDVPTGTSDGDVIATCIWASLDGSTIAIITEQQEGSAEARFAVQTRSKRGWSAAIPLPGAVHASLSGRSARDLYASTDKQILHFDGERWWPFAKPNVGDVRSISAVGDELLLASAGLDLVHHRRRSAWSTELLPVGTEVIDLFGEWAIARNKARRPIVLRRSTSGTWVEKTPPSSTASDLIVHAWTSPTGDAFFAAGRTVFRFSNERWSELASPLPITYLWGRSSTDVYGGSMHGLAHFDGNHWSKTLYTDSVEAISGTPTEVFVARGHE